MNTILHVEDNIADVLLTQEAFNSAGLSPNYVTAKNGKEGLAYLKSEATLPKLILLDINMPVLNGKEFLKLRSEDERLRKIPVVMLTTSSNPDDLKSCYDLHANAYLTKTNDFDEYIELLSGLYKFWFEYNEVASIH